MRADVAETGGAKQGIGDRVEDDIGVAVAREAATMRDRDPAEHHQFVIASGRPADLQYNLINQLSFRVDSLQTLRDLHEQLKSEPGVKIQATITHGNALSVYFFDPEGNRVEFLIDTPWHVPQPFRVPVDLSLPDDQLWETVEKRVRATPGFKPMAEWKAEIRKKIDAASRRDAVKA